jgi:hypothetical protein
MFRASLIAFLLLTAVARGLARTLESQWKQNGYIGSCAGRGCLGHRSECSVYSFPNAEGGRNTFYCYLDP